MTIRTLLNTTWLIKESSLAYSAGTYSINFSSRDANYTSFNVVVSTVFPKTITIPAGIISDIEVVLTKEAGSLNRYHNDYLDTLYPGNEIYYAEAMGKIIDETRLIPDIFVESSWLGPLDDNSISYDTTDVNTQTDGWVHEGYRLIVISGGTDVENATLIAWLKANATLMGMQLVTYNTLKKFKEEMINFVLSHVGPGYWSPYTAYNAGEVFFYGKMIYVCKANAAAGTLPTNTTYFDPLITNS